MITISKGILEQKMHEYLQQVEATGEEIIVTNRKVPILKIVSLKKKRNVDEVFADVQGKIKYHGNLLEPETYAWGEC